MSIAIGYIRVSTQKQGKSGLGLEAQQSSIKGFAASDNIRIVEWHQDIETGSHDARDGLNAALKRARLLRCPIVVAKLDRLSRDAHFVMSLMKEGVEFICTDLGRQSDPFILGMFALLAQKERELISRRTKEALAAAKARGVKLGNPNLKLNPGNARTVAIARDAYNRQRAAKKALAELVE
jgi:DNA invertase Pin-like site-specific DNA recombinase